MLKRSILFVAALMLLTACSNDRNPLNTDDYYVHIYKYDGSIQCEFIGYTVEQMKVQLTMSMIRIVDCYKSSDGMDYPAVCGYITGRINVYVIPRNRLDDALDLGFQVLPGD
ncbi:MAG: hypothetical protein GY839_19970 [candidate division Zixibacteria bacterium]|nr:hypothetical protein [candidate division Zixibacteria bacterium]